MSNNPYDNNPEQLEKDKVEIFEGIKRLKQENKMLKAHISDIDPKEIIKYQDIDHLLEAIGAERVGEWFMGLGSQ